MHETFGIRRNALRLLLGGAAALALAACGRKGAPVPPYDADPCYPRHYPMPEGVKEECRQKEIYAREHPPQPPEKKGQKGRGSAPAQPAPAQPSATPPSGEPPAPQSPPAQPNPPEAPR